ncbi:GMC oxidoreductase [Ammoniphilus sp. 3BR4]|uniref:GMC oxidoreductase n=1 Tax=Ammoniphilus sp. 3BR4 TaxID=3158265 RepID=UPI0034663B98
MIKLKIYIAQEEETLIHIARKHHVNLDEVIFQNPHIVSPDTNIGGEKVRIPSPAIAVRRQINLPTCPFGYSEEPLDHWIPTVPLENMAETEYDVIIVGSGAGGGAVLWRLCEKWAKNGKRIGIIEAGDLLLPTHAQNLITMNSARFSNYLYNPRISTLTSKYSSQYPGAKQVFALGGKTLFWSTLTPRLDISEIRYWPVSIREMEYYYGIAERVMNVTQEYTKGSSITEVLIKRLQEAGYPEAKYVPMAVDLQLTKYGEVHSNVFFSSIALLARALNLRSFDLAVKARAVEVLAEQGKVTGIRVMSPEKKSYDLKAKSVVLSASSFETPRLLLNSGIQGPAIGHYLTNHSFVRASAKINLKRLSEVMGSLGILVPQRENRPYQIQIHGPGGFFWYHPVQDKPIQEEWEIGFAGFGKVESRVENRITLHPNQRDEFGVPVMQIHFSYSKKDKMVIHQMTEAIQQVSNIMGTPLISRGGHPVCMMPIGSDFHESGTCRMGEDPDFSATDRYGQIHGISGLYVADNSVLPSIGAANPVLTIVALAIRTADYMSKQIQ